MARTSTYVAFDGQDTTDPTKSDIHYFNLLKAWDNSHDIEFHFSNAHDKTNAVRDSSKKATLLATLKERLSKSKNFLVIISEDTNYDKGILNWEIEQAIDTYKLPIIVVYPGFDKIQDPQALSDRWSKALKNRIDSGTAKCIHIPFKKEPILDAISQFSVVDEKYPKGGSLGIYSDEAYKSWGL